MDILQERAQVVQQVIDLTTGSDTSKIVSNIQDLKTHIGYFIRQRAAEAIAELMDKYENMEQIEPLALKVLAENNIILFDTDRFFNDINRMDVSKKIILNKIDKYEL